VETYSSLAPRVEAVGLPYSSERATTTPRRYIYHNNPKPFPTLSDVKVWNYPNTHMHERLSLLLFSDEYEVSYAFNTSRTKRVIYAFSINGILKALKKTLLSLYPYTGAFLWGWCKDRNLFL